MDATLDLRGEVCPMTFVRTRLALDRLAPGQILEVLLKGEEPQRSVPRSALQLGHRLIGQTTDTSGIMRLRIERR